MPSAPYTKPAVRAGWADTASGWSSPSTTSDVYDPDSYAGGTVSAGWTQTTTPPARQFFNWVLNYVMDGVRYLCGQGVATWDTLETYVVGATTLGSDKVLYRCILQHSGKDPSSGGNPTYWAVPQVSTATSPQPVGTVSGFDNGKQIANTAFVTSALTTAVSMSEAFTSAAVAPLAPLASPGFTGSPTAPTAATNTSSAQLATTAFANPGSSLVTNGWERLPSGRVMQWGYVASASNGTNAVSFITSGGGSFSSVLNLSLTLVNTAAGSPAFGVSVLPTTSGFSVEVGGTGYGFYWQAIGIH